MDSGAGNTRIRPCATSTPSTESFIFNHFMHPIILLSPPVLFMHGAFKVLASYTPYLVGCYSRAHLWGLPTASPFARGNTERGMEHPSHFLHMVDVRELVKSNEPCLLFRITLRHRTGVQTSELVSFHDKNNYRG